MQGGAVASCDGRPGGGSCKVEQRSSLASPASPWLWQADCVCQDLRSAIFRSAVFPRGGGLRRISVTSRTWRLRWSSRCQEMLRQEQASEELDKRQSGPTLPLPAVALHSTGDR